MGECWSLRKSFIWVKVIVDDGVWYIIGVRIWSRVRRDKGRRIVLWGLVVLIWGIERLLEGWFEVI